MGLADRIVDHPIIHGIALLLAFSAIGLVASLAFLAVDVTALQTDTLLDHLDAVVAGHRVHESF